MQDSDKQGGPGGIALDWSQWLCPGPRRVFSAEEMNRAGRQPWPRNLNTYVLGNVLLLMVVNFSLMPREVAAWTLPVVLVCTWLSLAVAAWLWKAPTRLRLNMASLGVGALLCIAALLLRNRSFTLGAIKVPAVLMFTLLVSALSCWWFLVIYRVQQIEARLRELDEQDNSIRLVRRLATAQIQPHFLFNTLASVQHWVDTRDERAGPTLASFTRYLRATLPMFERETLTLAEELQIVRSYLEVMQARLGERLRWHIDATPALDHLALPPGLLLTLVENAIGHGIEPSLRGGSVRVVARAEGARAVLEVEDDGAGPCGEIKEGLGLSNSRERLRQAHGEHATLSLTPLTPGCLARIEIPLESTPQ